MLARLSSAAPANAPITVVNDYGGQRRSDRDDGGAFRRESAFGQLASERQREEQDLERERDREDATLAFAERRAGTD